MEVIIFKELDMYSSNKSDVFFKLSDEVRDFFKDKYYGNDVSEILINYICHSSHNLKERRINTSKIRLLKIE